MKTPLANIIATTENLWQIEGRLSFDTVKLLLHKSKEIFKTKSDLIEIDLSQISYSDSSGLALLAEWQHLAQRRKKNIIFKNLPKQLFNMAKLSKLDKILNIEITQHGE
jgi:phospholipid transport system transporter-binding protein